VSDDVLLELSGVRKRFGAVQALDGVDLRCARGEVHALLGENGAGKSTLMHVVAGLNAPDAGELRLAGRPVAWRSADQARAAGIAMVHQHFMLVPTMTVAENVALALGERKPFRPARLVDRVSALAAARGIDVGDPRRVVEELSVGAQQRVEILKALVGPPTRLLILDEPTAVLTPEEVDGLFAMLRALAASGTTILIVTHKLREALAIADRVTVLRRGRVVGRGVAAQLDEAALAALMVEAPEALDRAAPPGRAPARDAPVVLRARGLGARDRRGALVLDDVSLEVASGEVAVVAGVEGNGQTELVQALSGVGRDTLASLAGEVTVDGRAVRSAADARAAGLAVVPPDRRRDGLVLGLELWENLLLAHDELAAASSAGVLGRRAAVQDAARRLAEYGVRPGDPRATAVTLSGGNQQRVVLARELGRRRLRAVVAANPTRGLDLLATVAVHDRLRAIAAGGAAVVVLSSDLDEVAALADRTYVLYHGRLVGPLPGARDRAEIGRLMAGVGVAA